MATTASAKSYTIKTWADDLEDRMGIKLYGNKGQRFLAILNAPLDEDGMDANTNDMELSRMVAWLAAKDDVRKPDVLTVETVFGWLKWYRKTRAGERRGFAPDTGDGFMPAVKAAMIRADSAVERWDIMCGALEAGLPRNATLDEIKELDAWAERRFAGWIEDRTQIRWGIAEALHRALDMLGSKRVNR